MEGAIIMKNARVFWGWMLLVLMFAAAIGSPTLAQTAEEQYVIGTYNIHIGKGMDGKLDLKRIANVIQTNKADVIGLQEVDRLTTRCQRIDQIAELKKLTNKEGVFGKSIDYQGGEYGIGILTSGRILKSEHRLFPEGKEDERRSFIAAQIELGEDAVFWALNTHLSLVAEDRAAQAKILLDYAKSLPGPVLIFGDFNDTPDGKIGIYNNFKEFFDDAWAATAAEPQSQKGFTFRADKPSVRIDYIWISKNCGWQPISSRIPQTQASDHLPLFATIKKNK